MEDDDEGIFDPQELAQMIITMAAPPDDIRGHRLDRLQALQHGSTLRQHLTHLRVEGLREPTV